MSPYTDEELEALLVEVESDLVERKESLQGDSPRTAREAICAFANDLPGHRRAGVLFVGVDDAGSSVELPITDELLRQLADAPVHVYWFDDRIEITSPGGPFGLVNRENFGEPGVVDYRNPNLAEALRVLGFVQRFGAGIATARRELAKSGNPPLELEPQSNHVLCRVRVR